ncbi:zeta toxin family protein [Undibacterium sp. TC9W]|uniref:zeta toxin family protein n=1 Tax=Undibacterium sp. TC9W TaxID=3413053 RepID=UPI003BF26ACE
MDIDGKLSPELHDKIFRQAIETQMLATTRPLENNEQLTAVFLGGQPGAGKGSLARQTMAELAPEKTVQIDIDKLREFHPSYQSWQSDSKTERIAADLTQPDAGAWGRSLLESAIEKKRNIVLDSTLGNTKGTEKQIDMLQNAGYQIIVRVLAVQPEVSHLGVLKRFEDGKQENAPRWVPPKIEKTAFENLPKTLLAIEQKQAENHVHIQVYDRDKTKLFDNINKSEQSTKFKSGVEALSVERQRPLNAKELDKYAGQWDTVINSMKKRDAPTEEIADANALATAMCSPKIPSGKVSKMDENNALLNMPISPSSRLLAKAVEPPSLKESGLTPLKMK